MKTIKFLLLAALMLTYTISTYGQDKATTCLNLQ